MEWLLSLITVGVVCYYVTYAVGWLFLQAVALLDRLVGPWLARLNRRPPTRPIPPARTYGEQVKDDQRTVHVY